MRDKNILKEIFTRKGTVTAEFIERQNTQLQRNHKENLNKLMQAWEELGNSSDPKFRKIIKELKKQEDCLGVNKKMQGE